MLTQEILGRSPPSEFWAVPLGAARAEREPPGIEAPWFKISLAEWSLHRTLTKGELGHLDFIKTAKRGYGLDGVEYVNTFFFDRAEDRGYLGEMKSRAEGEAVRSLLIMCDGEVPRLPLDTRERGQ